VFSFELPGANGAVVRQLQMKAMQAGRAEVLDDLGFTAAWLEGDLAPLWWEEGKEVTMGGRLWGRWDAAEIADEDGSWLGAHLAASVRR
jgi:hypothetical protein